MLDFLSPGFGFGLIEKAVRASAIDRTHRRFVRSEAAGKRAAVRSFLDTAKLNDIEPYAWFADVLTCAVVKR